jgi:mannose-6-phosphate isomerase-like protein (cupin superfamily)
MIEHGQVSPSVNSLKKVLDGVPMTLAEFFSLDLNENARVFYKSSSLNEEVFGDIIRKTLRIAGKNSNGILATQEKFLPGSDTGEDMLSQSGSQAGFIVKGQLEVTVGGEVEQLESGDAFYFPRRRPYRFRNLSTETSEIVSMIVPEALS